MQQPVTKNYVYDLCDYLKKDEKICMKGDLDLDLGGNKIVNIKEPLSNFDTVIEEYFDKLFTYFNERKDQLCKQ